MAAGNGAALIVQNKGGGHGELGYQLAKVLSGNDKIKSVTILQDEACKDTAEPFCHYSTDLPNVKVIKAPLSGDASEEMTAESLQGILGGPDVSYDYIWDNCSKGPTGAGKAVCDAAKAWDVEMLVYVSSAGMYLPAADGPFPMPETTTIKESAGQAQYDSYAAETLGLPLVSARPQYIYGHKSNKWDYIDWYFDRLVRGLTIPIPGDGTQKVSLTNSEDVATLLASPLNDPAAAVKQRYFNCGSDNLYGYDEVAQMCAAVAGIDEVKIAHYDGDELGKGTFPFRLSNFYVAPDAFKSVLGWPGAANTLEDDLKWYYESYKARGGAEKELKLEKEVSVEVSV